MSKIVLYLLCPRYYKNKLPKKSSGFVYHSCFCPLSLPLSPPLACVLPQDRRYRVKYCVHKLWILSSHPLSVGLCYSFGIELGSFVLVFFFFKLYLIWIKIGRTIRFFVKSDNSQGSPSFPCS